MIKRGRPRKPDAKRSFVGFRMDENEISRLDEMCKESGLTRTDLVREGIELFREKKNMKGEYR